MQDNKSCLEQGRKDETSKLNGTVLGQGRVENSTVIVSLRAIEQSLCLILILSYKTNLQDYGLVWLVVLGFWK